MFLTVFTQWSLLRSRGLASRYVCLSPWLAGLSGEENPNAIDQIVLNSQFPNSPESAY